MNEHARTDRPESSKNSYSGGCLPVTTCLPAGFNPAQPKPNKLQSLREQDHMEKVIKLDVCVCRPSFHFCAIFKMPGSVKPSVFLMVVSPVRLQRP